MLRIAKLETKEEKTLTVKIPARVHGLLESYADAYQQAHGAAITSKELIPVILEEFLKSDRGFQKFLASTKQPKKGKEVA